MKSIKSKQPSINPSETPTTQSSSLRHTYFEALRGKRITAVAMNGFWLKGRLEDFETSDLYLRSNQYSADDCYRTVLTTQYAAIIPPEQQKLLEDLQFYNSGAHMLPQRSDFLSKLLGKEVVSIACNGYRLRGDLMAFDGEDLLIRTDVYGGIRYVLVVGYRSVYPAATPNSSAAE